MQHFCLKEAKSLRKEGKIMDSAFRIEIEPDGIYFLVFDTPDKKVNVLNPLVLKELEQVLNTLLEDKNMKGLVIISNKKNIFIAGADISVIYEINDKQEGKKLAQQGKEILSVLDNLPVPSLAAINGACLGGGLELALFCSYRLATDNSTTKLGLPEVNLGILPGFGGTQTLPRLIGIRQSLDMILTGKIIDAKKALKLGLVDKIVPETLLREFAKKFMQEVLTHDGYKKVIEKRKIKTKGNFLLEGNIFGQSLIFSKSRNLILQKTGGHYPAPLKALDVIRKGLNSSLERAFEIESEALGDLAVTHVCKNLIDIYFWNENAKKSGRKETAKSIKKVGVLGAGVMGGGIAQLLSNKAIDVRMKDIKKEAIIAGLKAAWKVYDGAIKRRKITIEQAKNNMMNISPTLDYSGYNKLDMVIEAVVEDMEIKKKVFNELENKIDKNSIIASNTSSLSISKMSVVLKHPERFVGLHFFNPVHLMPLIEIIKGDKTDECTVNTAVCFALSIGKVPVIVKDKEGFLVNRILMPYLNEAGKLLDEGVSIETIDKSARNFGLPMGPLELMDEIGIDVGHKVALIMENAFGSRMKVSDSLNKIYEDKRFGKKIGKGFYYHSGKNKSPDENYADQIRQNKGKSELKEEDVLERMLLVMINEAVRCLEEQIVSSPGELDLAMIMGTGFPASRGGILKYADTIGSGKIYDKLKNLENKYGMRYTPAEKLNQMASAKEKFYK
ncbi:MAG: enoyl-CoA hydratase/isomerase family protein [Candidatus Firestonebacteria bacterium]|nr:enoyl-CoA hydratase/isomerase family protein [Candidatus Firestonebacteria bacterium]